MEYTVKDKLLTLIFPAVCVIYGLTGMSFYFHGARAVFINAVPVTAVLGGLTAGLISILLKVRFEPYLKILTVGTVIVWLFFTLIVTLFTNPTLGDIFHAAVLGGAVFLMTVKMPDEAPVGDRLLVTFANPVFYALLNKLCLLLMRYLFDLGVFTE